MLQATEIACVRGHRELFSEISFTVERGSALRVQGENGTGKTSLLRILAGLSPAAAGEVRWDGEPLARQGESFRRELLFVGHANGLKDDLSALENLRQALAVGGIPAPESELRAALAQDGLEAIADYPVQWLSQGQKRRAALTRLAFASARRLWRREEPCSALDVHAVSRLAARLARHVAGGGQLVFTTHQEIALDVPTQALVLQ